VLSLVALAVPAILCLEPQARAAGVTVTDQWLADGRVALDNGAWRVAFAKGDATVRIADLSGPAATDVMSLVPIGADGNRATGLTTCTRIGRAPDQVGYHATFAAKSGPIELELILDSRGAIRVQPADSLRAVAVSAALRYAVLPSRQLDDDIYDAADYPRLTRLCLPSENLLLGLVEGGHYAIVLAWPSGDQSAAVTLGGAEGRRRLEALEVTLAGRELFIGACGAPGLWVRKALDPSFEEQDVALDWKPPFDAAWKTQLTELSVPTTFRCLPDRRRPWRPTVGFYIWPFFTENGKPILHLHKKLACEGRALVYALEGNAQTPYAFLTRNLPVADQQNMTELQAGLHYYVLDPNPTAGGLLMNAHCAGRDQLKTTTLTVGAQTREAAFLETHMLERAHECSVIATYHIQRSFNCMAKLEALLDGWLKQGSSDAATVTFLHGMREALAAMQREYRDRLGGETPESITAHAQQVAERFKTVVREDAGRELCPEILSDINELNSVISLEEDQGRRFGTWGRKLFQQAGYACVTDPQAAVYARQIRAVLRDHLRYRQYETPGTAGYPQSLLPGG